MAKVGKYLADYSLPTARELAQPTGAEDLLANSRRAGTGGPWSRELVKAISMDIGKAAVHHLEIMYPAAVAACPATMKLSLRNCIHNEIMAAIEVNDEGQIVARLKDRKERRRKIKAAYAKIREPR